MTHVVSNAMPPVSPPRPLSGPPHRGVQPLTRNDLSDVARLFNQVFRRRSGAPSNDLLDYLDRIFLQAPAYTPENGSLVHRNAERHIDSALLALPMPFQIHGTKITARLLCAFMADGRAGLAGAARLARAIRVSHPDFCFSDNSSPVSADHWTTAGGEMLPIQSLEWCRIFRPVAYCIERARKRQAQLNVLPLSFPARILDRAIQRGMPSLRAKKEENQNWVEADLETTHRCFSLMTQHFSFRPAWTLEEFNWLMVSAALDRTQGTLTSKVLIDDQRQEIGCCIYFHNPNKTAHVLNVFSWPGKEMEVINSLFFELETSGHVAARGMSQPFLMNSLMRSGRISFRHHGYFCMITDRNDVRDAAHSNEIYIGGLASESWSRLVTDFF